MWWNESFVPLDVHPTNLQMQDAILSIWANISKECFQHLVESVPRRTKAVLKAGPLWQASLYFVEYSFSVLTCYKRDVQPDTGFWQCFWGIHEQWGLNNFDYNSLSPTMVNGSHLLQQHTGHS